LVTVGVGVRVWVGVILGRVGNGVKVSVPAGVSGGVGTGVSVAVGLGVIVGMAVDRGVFVNRNAGPNESLSGAAEGDNLGNRTTANQAIKAKNTTKNMTNGKRFLGISVFAH
jgi:hypothetical protein